MSTFNLKTRRNVKSELRLTKKSRNNMNVLGLKTEVIQELSKIHRDASKFRNDKTFRSASRLLNKVEKANA